MTKRSQSVFTCLTVDGALKAHEFYKKAFDATIANIYPVKEDETKLLHSEVTAFGSIIYVNDSLPDDELGGPKAPPELKGTTSAMSILFDTTEEVDKVFKAAKDAGAKVESEPADQFWGDYYASIIDPFGHRWSFRSEISEERTKAAMKAQEQGEQESSSEKKSE